jgi:signal transduction histidine kinase
MLFFSIILTRRSFMSLLIVAINMLFCFQYGTFFVQSGVVSVRFPWVLTGILLANIMIFFCQRYWLRGMASRGYNTVFFTLVIMGCLMLGDIFNNEGNNLPVWVVPTVLWGHLILLPVAASFQCWLSVRYQRLQWAPYLKYGGLLLLFWGTLASVLYGGIYGFFRLIKSQNVLILGVFMLLYMAFVRLFYDHFKSRWEAYKVRLLNQKKMVFDHFSTQIGTTKSFSHILNAYSMIQHSFDGLAWCASFRHPEEKTVMFGRQLSDEIMARYQSHFQVGVPAVQICLKKSTSELQINLSNDRGVYGWVVFFFPRYWDMWLYLTRPLWRGLVMQTLQAIRRVYSHDRVNTKIKHMANVNEFVSRLSLSSEGLLTHDILLQLKQVTGVAHLILPSFLSFSKFKEVSTVYVPKYLRHQLSSVQLTHLVSYPFSPVFLGIDDPTLPKELHTILVSYKMKGCYILPIANEKTMVGYYIALTPSSEMTLDLSLIGILNNQISSFIYRMVTRRQIESTKQFYQSVIDHLSSMIIVLDPQNTIIFTNKLVVSFFERTYDTMSELISDYPVLSTIISSEGALMPMNIQLKEQHFKVSLRTIDANRTVIFLTDVTELVTMQQTITKSEKLKGMGTFVAGVAHEIKNPLVAVKTFTELVSKDWANESLRTKCMEIVTPQLHRIRELGESLEHFGQHHVETFKPLNLSKVLNEIRELLMAKRSRKNIEVVIRTVPNLMVLASQDLLTQVIINLLDAVETVKKPSIHLSLNVQDSHYLILDIQDNGCGIPTDKQPFLFDPFFTTKDDGTGLGLSIVHQIILDHQGTIELLSSSDQGTIFRILLPQLTSSKPLKKAINVI